MASVTNPFAMLEPNVMDGMGQSKKAKKKKKDKAAATAAEPSTPSAAAPVKAVKAPPPQSPGKVAAAAAAEAASASEWSSQRSSGGGKSHHPEAGAKATAGDADSRAKMWRDWLAQVKGKGATASSFAASVLSTGALETTVASCLATRLVGGDQAVLEAVLAAFLPPFATAAAKPLVTTVAQLSAALVNESADVMLAAQRAVSSAVAALKVGTPDADALLPELARVDREVADKAARLEELESAHGADAKLGERTRASLELLKLTESRLELVAKGGARGGGGGKGAAAGAATEAGLAVTELGQLAAARLRAARELSKAGSSAKGGGAKGKAAATATPSAKDQADALAKQAAALAAQVAAAEARLVELKAQHAAVERSRAELVGAEKLAPGSAKASLVDTAATAAQAVQRHQAQQAAARALEAMLSAIAASPPAAAAAAAAATTPAGRAAAAAAPAAYLTALERQLRYKVTAQAALSARLERVHKNSAMSRMNLEAMSGLGMEEQQAQFASKANSMVKDIVGAADELKAGVETLKAGLNRHVRSFNSACAPALQRIDAVLAQLQAGHDTLLAAVATGGAPVAEEKPAAAAAKSESAKAGAPFTKKAARGVAAAAADAAPTEDGPLSAEQLQAQMAKLQAQMAKLQASQASTAAAPVPAAAAAPTAAAAMAAASRPATAGGGKGNKGAGKGGGNEKEAVKGAATAATPKEAPKEAPPPKEAKKEEGPKANGAAAASPASAPAVTPTPAPKANRGWGTVQRAPVATESEGGEPTPAEAAAAGGGRKGKKASVKGGKRPDVTSVESTV